MSIEGALRDPEDLSPHPETAPTVAKQLLNLVAESAVDIRLLGFNCAPPEVILECLKAIGETDGLNQELSDAGIALGAWANVNDRANVHSGKGFSVAQTKDTEIVKRADLWDPENGFMGYAEYVKQFTSLGASYIGG